LEIKVYFRDLVYEATLVNQSFDEEKYPAHGDIRQVRYGRNSPLARRLRELFAAEYHWLKSEREKRGRSRKPLRLPEEMEKLLLLTCGSQKKLCLLTAH
jgi:5-methylcytosine-specific restriction enzyme A